MSQEPNKTPDQAPKRPEQITEVEIKQVAFARAERSGWRVGLDDCRVQKVLPRSQVRHEIGLGTTTTHFPVTKWIVDITPKAPPHRYTAPLRAAVEFSWGSLSVEDFEGPEHPN